MHEVYLKVNYVYILRCRDNTFYCGWTTDLTERIAAHNSGKGAKYTRSRLPAMSREWHIKRMTREEKTELIAQQRKQS